MPLYEYRCEKCGNRFEEILSHSRATDPESPSPECRACGSPETKRELSAFAVGGQGDLRETAMRSCGPSLMKPKDGGGGGGHQCGGGCTH